MDRTGCESRPTVFNRVKAAGIALRIDRCWNGEHNGAPSVYSARDSLADRFSTLAHVPMGELRNHKPPDDCANLPLRTYELGKDGQEHLSMTRTFAA
jgi:hypothetical protein